MTSNRSVSEMVLKPCPFCGGERFEIGGAGFGEPEWQAITCSRCATVNGASATRELAIERWNTRASSQAQSDDVVERIHAALTWIGPLFIDEETPADELRRRISFCRADAESALATLNESSAISAPDQAASA